MLLNAQSAQLVDPPTNRWSFFAGINLWIDSIKPGFQYVFGGRVLNQSHSAVDSEGIPIYDNPAPSSLALTYAVSA